MKEKSKNFIDGDIQSNLSQPNLSYHEQMDIQNTLQLREVLKTLPSFASSAAPT